MKKNILFVINNMAMGGVQKVLINLLNGFDYQNYNVDLLILSNHGDFINSIPKEVNIIDSGRYFDIIDKRFSILLKNKDFSSLFRKSYFFFLIKTGLIKSKIINKRRKMITTNYDTEISFNDGFCTLFVAYGNSPKKLNWIHYDYKVNNYSKRYNKIIKDALKKIDTNVAVSDEVGTSFQEIYSLDKTPTTILNIINDQEILEKAREKIDFKYDKKCLNFISVGRIDYQKAYERFLEVHKRLINEGYHYKFYLIGDGCEQEKIKNKIKEYGLENNFILLGKKSNPYAYVKDADLFILPSLFEGMPTVVFESLILHVPVLSTKVAGINYLLGNKLYGPIVDNSSDGIYYGLKKILDNPKILKEYKNNLKDYKIDNQKSYSSIYKII